MVIESCDFKLNDKPKDRVFFNIPLTSKFYEIEAENIAPEEASKQIIQLMK